MDDGAKRLCGTWQDRELMMPPQTSWWLWVAAQNP